MAACSHKKCSQHTWGLFCPLPAKAPLQALGYGVLSTESRQVIYKHVRVKFILRGTQVPTVLSLRARVALEREGWFWASDKTSCWLWGEWGSGLHTKTPTPWPWPRDTQDPLCKVEETSPITPGPSRPWSPRFPAVPRASTWAQVSSRAHSGLQQEGPGISYHRPPWHWGPAWGGHPALHHWSGRRSYLDKREHEQNSQTCQA